MALKQAPQDHGTKPTGIQEAFGQYSQTHDLNIGWFCVVLDQGIGLNDLCQSISTKDINHLVIQLTIMFTSAHIKGQLIVTQDIRRKELDIFSN